MGEEIQISRFKYCAVNMEGREIQGVLEGKDRKDVVDALRKKGFFPIRVKSEKIHKGIGKISILHRISSKDLSIFCKQYSSILKAGVPLVQGLNILINQTENLFLKRALERTYFLVQGGHSLSQAMQKQNGQFPTMLIQTIESGEWSGSLEVSLDRMAYFYEKQYKLKLKIRKALTYPVFLAIISIIIVSFLLHTVVPQFIVLFDNAQAQLPVVTSILLRCSNFVINNTLILLFIPIIFYIMFRLALSSSKITLFLHRILLKLPYIGSLINKIISARFNRTFAILISAGIPITQSLSISQNVTNNEYIKERLTKGSYMVQQGRGLAKSLKTLDIFTTEIINVIAIGEESGQIEEMMNKTADISELEAESAIDKFVSMIEPISILLLGGIIAFIVIAITLPMLEMYSFLD